MKNKHLWIWLGVLVLIGAAFLFLNFRVAASTNQIEKLIFSTDMGDNMPVPMQQREKISIVLIGKGPLVRALQKALTEQLGNAGIGEIDLVQELKPEYQNPILVVKVSKPGPFWTPIFAMGKFSVHAGYASDGDSTFMEDAEKTHVSIGKKDVANMYAEFIVNDRSFGLISRPGYHQFLADYLVQDIVTALEEMYHVQNTFLP